VAREEGRVNLFQHTGHLCFFCDCVEVLLWKVDIMLACPSTPPGITPVNALSRLSSSSVSPR